jgi:hypothetical protein
MTKTKIRSMAEIIADGGVPTRDENIELAKRFVWKGFPTRKNEEKTSAGRPSKKTQYDVTLKPRKELLRRLVQLPKNAPSAGKKSNGELHLKKVEQIQKIHSSLPDTENHKLVSTIHTEITSKTEYLQCSQATVRRILKSLLII